MRNTAAALVPILSGLFVVLSAGGQGLSRSRRGSVIRDETKHVTTKQQQWYLHASFPPLIPVQKCEEIANHLASGMVPGVPLQHDALSTDALDLLPKDLRLAESTSAQFLLSYVMRAFIAYGFKDPTLGAKMFLLHASILPQFQDSLITEGFLLMPERDSIKALFDQLAASVAAGRKSAEKMRQALTKLPPAPPNSADKNALLRHVMAQLVGASEDYVGTTFVDEGLRRDVDRGANHQMATAFVARALACRLIAVDADAVIRLLAQLDEAARVGQQDVHPAAGKKSEAPREWRERFWNSTCEVPVEFTGRNPDRKGVCPDSVVPEYRRALTLMLSCLLSSGIPLRLAEMPRNAEIIDASGATMEMLGVERRLASQARRLRFQPDFRNRVDFGGGTPEPKSPSPRGKSRRGRRFSATKSPRREIEPAATTTPGPKLLRRFSDIAAKTFTPQSRPLLTTALVLVDLPDGGAEEFMVEYDAHSATIVDLKRLAAEYLFAENSQHYEVGETPARINGHAVSDAIKAASALLGRHDVRLRIRAMAICDPEPTASGAADVKFANKRGRGVRKESSANSSNGSAELRRMVSRATDAISLLSAHRRHSKRSKKGSRRKPQER